MGADHRTTTSVYRRGTVDKSGVLHGDLVFVGAGDLTFGGRRTKNDENQFTDFDHNDANNLGTAELTPQDPLTALKDLAAQVRASGIKKVDGNVVVDDRLFPAYRVPNQQLLITPTMLNEDKVDVTVTPTEPGKPAHITYRPKVPGFRLVGTVRTTAKGTDPTVAPAPGTQPNGDKLPGVINCFGHPGCTGRISGTIPVGYRAPLSGDHEYVGVFRIDSPENLARSALMNALQQRGVRVGAPAVTTNPASLLPKSTTYPRTTRVAAYTSAPYAQEARLILKVSLNLGANLALTKFGLAHGVHTLSGALALERQHSRVDGRAGQLLRLSRPTAAAAPTARPRRAVSWRCSTAMSRHARRRRVPDRPAAARRRRLAYHHRHPPGGPGTCVGQDRHHRRARNARRPDARRLRRRAATATASPTRSSSTTSRR